MAIIRINNKVQYEARILSSAEVGKLLRDLPDSPLAKIGTELAGFSGALLVFEDPETGMIVAHWPLMLAWHAEPCYIHPTYRGDGDLINQMIDGLRATMAKLEVPMVFASADEAAVAKILSLLGFHRVPGEMYYAHATDPAPPQG